VAGRLEAPLQELPHGLRDASRRPALSAESAGLLSVTCCVFASAILPPPRMELLHTVITWLVETIGVLGYPGIIILMALESSFFPFPSEVIMVPAGYLASKGEMNLIVVVLAGTFGSLLGAWLNYAIACTMGRAALLKWGHRIFLPEERFLRVERFLKEHGAFGTFIGRLIPVVRQYISFPAGVIHMPLWKFSLLTALGAGGWVGILAMIGFYAGENEELVAEWSKTALFWLLVGCAVLVAVYWKWRSNSQNEAM